MKSKIAVALFIGAIVAQTASATVITLGDVSFADQTQQNSGAFQATDTGELAPFDGSVCGGADSAGNCSTSWTFNYSLPVGDVVIGATLSIGVGDLDTHAAGDQIASVTIGGIDVTSLMNTVAESIDPSVGPCLGDPGGNRNCWGSIYRQLTITLPSATFAALGTGSVTVNFSTQAPGWGVLGNTAFNAVNLDYSTLDVTSVPLASLPEPASFFSMGVGLAGLGLIRYRRQK